MTYRSILNIINGECLCGNLDTKFTGIFVTDSRKINPGDCFIAINNGQNYINSAIELGANLIICNCDFYDNKITVFKVSDTKNILLSLANLVRTQNLNIPVIAITGSVGKTTTKELIYEILTSKYRVLKNEGNKNNRIGMSETLFSLNQNYDICVLEMGMNHSGEINELSVCALPDDVVITNVGTSHIGYLKSKRNIFKAKCEILNGMRQGTLFINGDDKYLKKIRNTKIVRVGLNRSNDLIAFNIISTQHHVYFYINYNNKRYHIKFNIPNETLIPNILIAIAVGLKYEISIEDIINRVELYKSMNHRNQIKEIKNTIIIDDCYNASFESIVGGLALLKNYNKKKIIIIGDVLELGKYSKKIHKKIGKCLMKEDMVILVGKEVKNIKGKNFIFKDDYTEVISYLDEVDINHKIIYLKGSRKMRLEEIRNYIEKRLTE
ncbi:MAG: UDP-N-acetylmuramoyl-tripeptide--D-alanyl-D-alanine ligase [Firmicutes bacterium]|nr:UDP-N-acetylmuramoyl-tripeptide--D-alanyl-D-alanine ligase [Bacillota bacterium]